MFRKLRVNICSKSLLKAGLFFLTFFVVGAVFDDDKGIGKITDTITGSFTNLAELFLAIAYPCAAAWLLSKLYDCALKMK